MPTPSPTTKSGTARHPVLKSRESAASIVPAWRKNQAALNEPCASDQAHDQSERPATRALTIPAANKLAIDKLRAETQAARAQHLAEGRLLPAAEFQQALAVTKQAVNNAVLQHRMFYLTGPSGEHLYPTFFTEDHYHRKDLYKVSKRLRSMPGGNKWQFFTKGKGSLEGKTPLEALAEGRLDDVLIAAAGFAER